jgi:hypothetical protein
MAEILEKGLNFLRKLRLYMLIGMVAIVGISMLGGLFSKKDPKQSFVIYNSGDKSVSVTFHQQKKDKTYTGYFDNIVVKPGDTKCESYSEGVYKVNVWDGNVEEKDPRISRTVYLSVKLADKDNYAPIYIDTTGSKYFAFVNLDFIYSGSELANNIAKDFGAYQEGPVIKKIYDGKRPFMIPEKYVVDLTLPDDKLPKKVSAGANVYALVPVPNTVRTKKEIYPYIFEFINSH